MRVNDLAFVSDEAPDDALSFKAWLHANASTPGVTVTVRDMGRRQVDGGAPHVDIEGAPPAVLTWLTTHYCADDPSALEDVLSSGVEWGPRHTPHAHPLRNFNDDGTPDRLPAAASDEWIERFKPRANLWNHYADFKVERLTTDKLQSFLNDLAQGHSFLIGGEPADVVTPAEDGYELVQLTHVGGRDWIAVLGNVGP